MRRVLGSDCKFISPRCTHFELSSVFRFLGGFGIYGHPEIMRTLRRLESTSSVVRAHLFKLVRRRDYVYWFRGVRRGEVRSKAMCWTNLKEGPNRAWLEAKMT